MAQHEYIFVAVSIILGLAITRLLHTVAMLILLLTARVQACVHPLGEAASFGL